MLTIAGNQVVSQGRFAMVYMRQYTDISYTINIILKSFDFLDVVSHIADDLLHLCGVSHLLCLLITSNYHF